VLDRIRQALELDRRVRSEEARRSALAARTASLTPRERDVMELVVEGKSNKLIAWELGLSAKTVEAHRAHLMEKMGVGSVADLVRLVLLGERAPAVADYSLHPAPQVGHTRDHLQPLRRQRGLTHRP
jgi:FixJ family two-component response regulator